MDSSEISNTSVEDAGDEKKARKHKKRSLVERELETNLTARITSPLTADDTPGSKSRYGRALKISAQTQGNEKDKPKLLKSPQNEIISITQELPITEMTSNQNLSLNYSKEGIDSTNHLLQNDKSKSSQLNNILEKSSENYDLPNNNDMQSAKIDFERKKPNNINVQESLELENTCEYQVCDMAWARVGSFPFWPCIISRDPYTDLFVRKKVAGKGEKLIIHVIFFGDNGRRGWVTQSMLRKFDGVQEFENAKQQLSPELKKKDPKLYAAFFISEKRQQKWKLSVEEAELIYKKDKNYRLDILSDILIQNRSIKVTSNKKENLGKIKRKSSDVSLSESLYDTLFSEDDSKIEDSDLSRRKRKALDVSEVVTACLDDMAAKTGLTDIKKQSHMDRWLQKAKSKTPEKGNRLSFSKERTVSKNKKSQQKKTPNNVNNSVSDVNSSTETSKEEETSGNTKIILNDKNDVVKLGKLPKKCKKPFSQKMNDSFSTENDLIQNISIGDPLSGDSFNDINRNLTEEIGTTDSSNSYVNTTRKQARKQKMNKSRKQTSDNVSTSLTSSTSRNESNRSIEELSFSLTSDSVPSVTSPMLNNVVKRKIIKSTPKRSEMNGINNNSDSMDSSMEFNSTSDENLFETSIENIDQRQDANDINESVISNGIKMTQVVNRKKRNQVKNKSNVEELINQDNDLNQVINESTHTGDTSDSDSIKAPETLAIANENMTETVKVVSDKSEIDTNLIVSETGNIETQQSKENEEKSLDESLKCDKEETEVLESNKSNTTVARRPNVDQEEKSTEIIDNTNEVNQNNEIQITTIINSENNDKVEESVVNEKFVRSAPDSSLRRSKSIADEKALDESPKTVDTNNYYINGGIQDIESTEINEKSVENEFDSNDNLNSPIVLKKYSSKKSSIYKIIDNLDESLEKLSNGHVELNLEIKRNTVEVEQSTINLSLPNTYDKVDIGEITALSNKINELKENSNIDDDDDSETELFINKSSGSPRTYKSKKKLTDEMPNTVTEVTAVTSQTDDKPTEAEEEALQSCDESIMSNESPVYDSDEDIQLSYSPLSALGDPDRGNSPVSTVYTMDCDLGNDFVENNKDYVNECYMKEIQSEIKQNGKNGRVPNMSVDEDRTGSELLNERKYQVDNDSILMKFLEKVRPENGLNLTNIHEDTEKQFNINQENLANEKSNGIISLNYLTSDPNFLNYVELKRDSLIDENPELSEKDIIKYLSETWKYKQGLKSTEMQVDEEEQSPKIPPSKTPNRRRSTRKSVRNTKIDNSFVIEKPATRNSTKTFNNMNGTINPSHEDKSKNNELDSKTQYARDCVMNATQAGSSNKDYVKNTNINNKSGKIIIKPVETINREKYIEPGLSLEIGIRNKVVNEQSDITETSETMESDINDRPKTNKNYDNPEFLKYVELKQDSLLDENPDLAKDELLAYLFKTWSYEQELKTDDMKMDDKKESNLIKGLDESGKPKSKKKARRIRKIQESSDEDSEFEISSKPQRLRLKNKTPNKENGLISWLSKDKERNADSNKEDAEENTSSDNVPAMNTIETTEVLANGNKASIDIPCLDSPELKTKKSKSLDDPDFLKYVELRQDALVDEFPELSSDEIIEYLLKTWSYEEKLKSDEMKNDDLRQSNLVKGLGDSTGAPSKKANKKRADVNKCYESDSTVKDKPRRKAASNSYYLDYDSSSDSDGLDNLDENGRPLVYSKSRDSGENSESVDDDGVVNDIEYFFHQMTQPKPNIFRGLVRERVCEICEMTTNLVKCSSCTEMFHVDCVRNQGKVVIEQSLFRGRKKKKTKNKKTKDYNDSEGNSDEKNNSIDEDDKSLEGLNTIDVKMDADEFEAKVEVNLKETINNDFLYDSQYSSEEEMDWNNTIAGQCEIVDFKLKPKVNAKCYADFKCNDCQKHDVPLCFVCKGAKSPKSGVELRQKCSVQHCQKYYHMDCLDHWPQTHINSGELTRYNKQPKQLFESFTCPRHVCHTCVCDDPRGCKTRFSADKLARCVRCPAVYHSFTKCLPAGAKVLTASHIICPRHYEHKPGKVPCHVNTGWCFICALGGTLICCEYCPMSFHAECLNIKPPEGGYMCEDCETGRLPLYGEMVWVKLGNYRWWPGLILHPSEIPDNVMSLKHYLGEFVVRFFGQYDHYWVNRGRVFPFQEGDSGKVSSQKNKIDAAFATAMADAQKACEIMKTVQPNHAESMDIQSSLLAPHYIKLKVNKPCGSVINWRPDDSEANSLTQCECDPYDIEPCGPDSQCLNRMLLTECGPTCRAGDRCFNRNFEKRNYPKMVAYRTSYRGWGLKTLEPIKKGQFVIEYVGELIDEEEFRRRMTRKHEIRDENFYFLTLDKDRIIDAGPKGNLARFMNHCCDPNCETQKWTVLGDVRVGLFAIQDIPANTEVNFNYNFECAGIEKKQCMCGAKRCSGYIGAKPKQLQEGSQSKRVKLNEKSKRVYRKRKNNTESPSASRKGRTKPTKPVELTEIEKDLLIIKSATNDVDSESEQPDKDNDSDRNCMKRKLLNVSVEEASGVEVKKQKIESIS